MCPGYAAGDSVGSVDYEIKTIEREELKAKLDRGDDIKLVMAMHEWGFRAAHIPDSLHFNTVEEALQWVGERAVTGIPAGMFTGMVVGAPGCGPSGSRQAW
jgi:hypothetical protein